MPHALPMTTIVFSHASSITYHMHPHYATLPKPSCLMPTTSPLADRPHNMSRVRMRGVLFPRPPSASLPFTVIQFFVYLRVDVTASGRLERWRKYKKKKQLGQVESSDRQKDITVTFMCDTLLCFGSMKYKIVPIKTHLYLDYTVYVCKSVTCCDLG